MVRLPNREFERLVLEALRGLPGVFRDRLDNLDVVVEDWPSQEELASVGLEGRYELLGLYHGVPLTDRYSYNMVLPDKISLFQRPIEAICRTRQDVVEQVRRTVVHEIAHHFGIDDEHLDGTGY